MRYYITTRQNTPLIHHIICAENIGMDPVVPCLFDDFFAAFLTKSGKKHNVQATFFLVGINVQRFPSVARRIKSEGHAIGVHTYSHKYLQIYMNVDSYLKDFSMAEDAIYSATGDRCAILTLSKKWVKKRARPANTKS